MRMKKKARSSGGGEVAANIDLLVEILIRVAMKPLVKLKCVSKQWLALISDDKFIDSHFDHYRPHQQGSPNSLIFSNKLGCTPSHILSFNTAAAAAVVNLDLDFLNQSQPRPVGVIQSCNGLLLCYLCRGLTSPYFICNPITRDFTTLNLSRHPCRGKIIHLYLAFEPSVSPRYKVVSVATTLDSPLEWVFHVYTFKSRRSRIGPGVSVSTLFELDAAAGVYFNGAIHWCYCYFHVDTQCLKNYPMPPPLSGSGRIEYFGESGGRLHLILPFKENHYDIFQLVEDYSGWLLRHRVDLNPIRVQFPHMNWHWPHVSFYIFHTVKDKNKKNKLSMSVLIVGQEGAIFHDLLGKTSSKICDFKMGTPTSLDIHKSLARWDHGRVHQHFQDLC